MHTKAAIGGVVLLALWGGTAWSADPGTAPDAEAAKQEAIYRSQGENVPSGYVVDRSLLAYGARNDDERDIGSFLAHDPERGKSVKIGQAEVGENQIRVEFLQLLQKLVRRSNAQALACYSCSFESRGCELCISGYILQHQDPKDGFHGDSCV